MTANLRAAAEALCDAPLDIDPATQPTIARHVAALRAALAAREPSDEEVARELAKDCSHMTANAPDFCSLCAMVAAVRAAELRARGAA